MSRSGTPSGSRRPHKPVSLAEWEVNAPLGETELASIAVVREACAARPLPRKVGRRGLTQRMAEYAEHGRTGSFGKGTAMRRRALVVGPQRPLQAGPRARRASCSPRSYSQRSRPRAPLQPSEPTPPPPPPPSHQPSPPHNNSTPTFPRSLPPSHTRKTRCTAHTSPSSLRTVMHAHVSPPT